VETRTRARMHRLLRKVRLAMFLGGIADATAVLALGAAAFLLVARFVGWSIAPDPLWLAWLVLPLAWGALRTAKTGITSLGAAAYVDRRFGLRGLLLASLERDASAWQDTLRARLADSPAAMPGLRGRRLGARALLPLLLLAGVLLLPPPAVAATHALNPLIFEALADFEQALDLAIEEGAVDDERGVEMRARLKQLKGGLLSEERVLWNDVDALQARLSHEAAMAESRAQRSRAALQDFARRARSGGAKAGSEHLAKMLEQAREMGRMPELPPELLKKLGAAMGENGLDASALEGMTKEQLAQLADALADAMAGDPTQLPPGEWLDPTQLSDLKRLVAGEFDPDHEHGPT